MRVVLADVRSSSGGWVSKDTVVGGYGSRLEPFSRVTRVISFLKQHYHNVPSVHMAYLAAILAQWGHEVRWSRGEVVEGDVALVLSSLVDYRNETAWADAMRARGARVGFVGITASKLPELFRDHADFLINGEPESAVQRLAQGEVLSGVVASEPIADLDSLPFPRWDLIRDERRPGRASRWSSRPIGGGFPLLASRGCPEFCTYCPHRILAGYRARSIANIADELEQLCERQRQPYVIFRDPLFTEQRDRMLELCDAIQARGLSLTFEAETRLDRLDPELLDRLYAAGFRAMSFGVESVSPATLKRSGRRPIPETHQRAIMEHCRKRGIFTAAFYVLGFLQDDWQSVAATIDYAVDLGSTFAQFKILTPYPGTPMFKQLQPLLSETDWQKFDGFTPTFRHPNLSDRELRFLLGAAYTRFYMRPSYVANLLKVQNASVRRWVGRLDRKVLDRHARQETVDMSRPVTC
ncbi:MAG: radical SAM protein [Acidobacteriota bacterium]|nr:radical SAM protein [Acidobacteriota bacterium]